MCTAFRRFCPAFKRPLFWIVLIGLVLRVASMSVNWPMMRWQNEPRMTIPAVRILEGKGLSLKDAAGPTAYRPPLYIFWLTGAYAIFGPFARFGPSLLQTLASAGNIILLYLLAKQIFKREDIANASAFLLAIHPYTVYHDPQLYHTFLTTGLLLGGFTLLFRGMERERAKPLVWSGVLFGLCLLVISVIVPFLGLLVLAGLTVWRLPIKRRFRLTGAFVLGLLIPWTPWIIRNAAVFHHFIPFTNEAGVTLYEGNNPEAAVRLKNRTNEEAPVPQGTKFNIPERYEGCKQPGWCQDGISEYDESKELTAMGMQWIKSHPKDFVQLTVWRFAGIWSPFLTPEKTFGSNRVINLLIKYGFAAWNLGLAVLMVIGIRKKNTEYRIQNTYLNSVFCILYSTVLLFALAVTATGAYALFLFYTKYRIPFEAALLPFAGAGLVRLFLQLRSSYRAD